MAKQSGFEAEGMAVADYIDTPVAETIVDVARERDAQAIVMARWCWSAPSDGARRDSARSKGAAA